MNIPTRIPMRPQSVNADVFPVLAYLRRKYRVHYSRKQKINLKVNLIDSGHALSYTYTKLSQFTDMPLKQRKQTFQINSCNTDKIKTSWFLERVTGERNCASGWVEPLNPRTLDHNISALNLLVRLPARLKTH